jgi:hypothetical protein
MALYDAPKSFVRRLQAYDPLLSVRWSDWEQRWRIERRLTHARSIDPGLFKEHQYEEFAARCAGRVPVLNCSKEQLDNRVFFTLWVNDIQRRGGGQKVADALEREEAAYYSKSRAKWLDTVYNQAKDYYTWMNTLPVSGAWTVR